MGETSTLLIAHSIHKKFGRRVILTDASITLNTGECAVLQGENGSGKSTFLRILAGALKPNGYAKIELNQQDYRSEAYRANIGYVSHHPMFYGDLSALENLSFVANLYRKPNNSETLIALLNKVHLLHRKNDAVRTFSRGMQQRLSIARAILINPTLFLFDEPYTGLDEKNTQTLNEIILEQKKRGAGLLITTHNPESTKEIADCFYRLVKGKTQLDTP